MAVRGIMGVVINRSEVGGSSGELIGCDHGKELEEQCLGFVETMFEAFDVAFSGPSIGESDDKATRERCSVNMETAGNSEETLKLQKRTFFFAQAKYRLCLPQSIGSIRFCTENKVSESFQRSRVCEIAGGKRIGSMLS